MSSSDTSHDAGNSDDGQDDEPEQQAVLIYFSDAGQADGDYEESGFALLEDELIEVIEHENLGDFDGIERGEGEVIFFMYGPDAERLFSGIEETLNQHAVSQGAEAIIRYGGPGSKQREVRIGVT